jgi:hypothetical protein
MQKTTRSFGEIPTWSAAHLARVTRLICLITEMKTNPRQTPEGSITRWGSAAASIFRTRFCLKRLWF